MRLLLCLLIIAFTSTKVLGVPYDRSKEIRSTWIDAHLEYSQSLDNWQIASWYESTKTFAFLAEEDRKDTEMLRTWRSNMWSNDPIGDPIAMCDRYAHNFILRANLRRAMQQLSDLPTDKIKTLDEYKILCY